jgi:hypothetical protein
MGPIGDLCGGGAGDFRAGPASGWQPRPRGGSVPGNPDHCFPEAVGVSRGGTFGCLGEADSRLQVLDVSTFSLASGTAAPEFGGAGRFAHDGRAGADHPGAETRMPRRGAGSCQPLPHCASGGLALRGRGVLARGDCTVLWPLGQLLEVSVGAGAYEIAGVVRAPRGSADMYNPIDKQVDGQARALADRLRQLPTEIRPPFNWQEFQRRSQQRRLPAGRGRRDWSYALAAALVVVLIGGLIVWSRVGLVNRGKSVDVTGPGVAKVNAERNPPGADAGQTTAERAQAAASNLQTATAELQAASEAVRAAREALEATDDQPTPERSRALESWLASLPREPAVVRVGTRAAVTGLEDRIADVDEMLTFGRLDGAHPERLAALQQERARLVGSLAEVRYAEFIAAGSM